MAIKVNGTTVINDSRALSNITSVDSTTASAIESAGVGASTTFGAVGTYIWGRPQNNSTYAAGATASGLYSAGFPNNNSQYTGSAWWETFSQEVAVSGTWRAMTNAIGSTQGVNGFSTLWVRIS